MEPAMDDELKLPLMLSLFGYDFLYKKLEFDESIGGAADDSNNAVFDGDDDVEDEDSDNDVGDTDAQFPLALLPVGPPPLSPKRDCRITLQCVCFCFVHNAHTHTLAIAIARTSETILFVACPIKFARYESLLFDFMRENFREIWHRKKHTFTFDWSHQIIFFSALQLYCFVQLRSRSYYVTELKLPNSHTRNTSAHRTRWVFINVSINRFNGLI